MSISQSGAASTAATGANQGAASLKGRGSALFVGAGGVLLTSFCAAALFVGSPHGASQSAGSEIRTVAADAIGAAMVTLEPGVASALASEAKACRAPLAMMVLSKATGSPESAVRIRSGSYLSPTFHIGATPVRIAVPFPTPYATGRGQLSVEGPQEGLRVTLYPTWGSANAPNANVINIWWYTDKPCG
jgi:hypothetical protein